MEILLKGQLAYPSRNNRSQQLTRAEQLILCLPFIEAPLGPSVFSFLLADGISRWCTEDWDDYHNADDDGAGRRGYCWWLCSKAIKLYLRNTKHRHLVLGNY